MFDVGFILNSFQDKSVIQLHCSGTTLLFMSWNSCFVCGDRIRDLVDREKLQHLSEVQIDLLCSPASHMEQLRSLFPNPTSNWLRNELWWSLDLLSFSFRSSVSQVGRCGEDSWQFVLYSRLGLEWGKNYLGFPGFNLYCNIFFICTTNMQMFYEPLTYSI